MPETPIEWFFPGADEAEVWQRWAEPQLVELPSNVLSICNFGITEMLNNVVDHSGFTKGYVTIEKAPDVLVVTIADDGIGIFRKIQAALSLENEHAALMELAKGRLTTDPERHSGEGIFFTARMFDRFQLLTGAMYVSFKSDGDDWIHEEPSATDSVGTIVKMTIDPKSERTTREVFDRFAEGGEPISRTHLAIRLAQPSGGALVSRSQAKRILTRLDQFKEAILDFDGVPEIGPAFADEVFRVYASTHSVRLIPVRANEAVMRMIVNAQERLARQETLPE